MIETDFSIRTFRGGYDNNFSYLVSCMQSGIQFLIDAAISLDEIKPYIMHLQVDQDIDEGLAETLKKCAVNFIPRALSMNEDFDYLDFDDIAEKHISLYRSQ